MGGFYFILRPAERWDSDRKLKNKPRNGRNVEKKRTLGYSPMVRHLSDIINSYSPLFGLFWAVLPVPNPVTGPI